MATDRKSDSLTERRIRDAKPGSRPFILWDRQVVGLGCKVAVSGTKTFILNYRVDGRERRAKLAGCSEMSLSAARERAGRELVAIRNGEGDPLRRRQESREAPTVDAGLDRFFEEFVPRRIADGRMSERTRYDYTKQADKIIRPKLGSLKIADVTRHDIERATAALAPVSRNRQLALLSRLFNLFEAWEWRAQNSNPVKGIEKAREQPRDRVLAPSEIEALAGALNRSTEIYAVAAIRFLTMTGWRSGEALALQWDHVNFETGEALLPTTKAGRQNRPLGAPALALLAELPKVNNNPFVFAGVRGVALGYRKLRIVFAEACAAAGIPDCRLHDLRRSVATTAAANGMSVFLLRDLLGHKSATMANRYARRAGSALQDAVDANAERMAAMMAGKTAEVVPLRRRDA